MQQWEYCAVVGMRSKARKVAPYYPAVWYFTESGVRVDEIKGDETRLMAQTIARLGQQGWEMVGCGMDEWDTARRRQILYFKRPKPQLAG